MYYCCMDVQMYYKDAYGSWKVKRWSDGLWQLSSYCFSAPNSSFNNACNNGDGPYKHFSFALDMMLNFVSRRWWRNFAGRRGFPSRSQHAPRLFFLLLMPGCHWHIGRHLTVLIAVEFQWQYWGWLPVKFHKLHHERIPSKFCRHSSQQSASQQWYTCTLRGIFCLLVQAVVPCLPASAHVHLEGVSGLMVLAAIPCPPTSAPLYSRGVFPGYQATVDQFDLGKINELLCHSVVSSSIFSNELWTPV